jgi:hypothetical protein
MADEYGDDSGIVMGDGDGGGCVEPGSQRALCACVSTEAETTLEGVDVTFS